MFDEIMSVLFNIHATRQVFESVSIYPHQIYVHLKSGNLYFVDSISIDEKTDEVKVNYYALYGECRLWSREINLFREKFRKVTLLKD